MKKRKDIQVFMMCHREIDFGLIDDEIITPIECGAAVCDNNICELKDNIGEDNISAWNEFFLEDTAMYWIWKNIKDAKYLGQTQYRRRLPLSKYWDYDRIFQDFDIIVAEPANMEEDFGINCQTVEAQYDYAHNPEDIRIIEDIIKTNHPDYAEDYDKYIKNSPYLYYSNGWVMRTEDYDKYCNFLFPILYEWLKRRDINEISDLKKYVKDAILNNQITCNTMCVRLPEDLDYAVKYQMRIGGFLAERIFTLYIQHNIKTERIYKIPYRKYDNISF